MDFSVSSAASMASKYNLSNLFSHFIGYCALSITRLGWGGALNRIEQIPDNKCRPAAM